MKLISPCEICHKQAFIIKKRSYNFKHLPMGKITSQDEICLRCKINVIRMITPESKDLIIKLDNIWTNYKRKLKHLKK